MPYKIIKVEGGYKIREGGSGDRPGHEFSKHPMSKRKALAQLMILRSHGHGEKYAADCKSKMSGNTDWGWSKDQHHYGE